MENKQYILTLFSHCKVHKIFGTAGSGKTTFLINLLEKMIKSGVNPNKIAFVSFTNKAVDEIVERCLKRFTQFNKDYFKYFKTIHSLCYKELENKQVISKEEIINLAKGCGMKTSLSREIEDCYGKNIGDKIINIESLSRLKMISLKEQWKQLNLKDCPFFMVKEWSSKLKKYKKENEVIDFTDMLENYDKALDVDYLFIDEAQDLSPLQWKVLHKASEKCKEVIIAGDDDQSIFEWAGADIDYILKIKSDKETVLNKSYRLPTKIYKLSRTLLKRIKKRKEKENRPILKIGNIEYVKNLKSMDFSNKKEYLVLVRNRHQISKIKKYLEKKGLQYSLFGKNSVRKGHKEAVLTWEFKKNEISKTDIINLKRYSSLLKTNEKDFNISNFFNLSWKKLLNQISYKDKEYISEILKKGYTALSSEPKIKISTIHQAKGGESDNVVLFTDVSHTVWKNINKEAEHRVWYVAITRSKFNLIIVKEQSNRFYKI